MTERMKFWSLFKLDRKTGEKYDLEYIARAVNPQTVIDAWDYFRRYNPAELVAEEADRVRAEAYECEVRDIETLLPVPPFERGQRVAFKLLTGRLLHGFYQYLNSKGQAVVRIAGGNELNIPLELLTATDPQD